MAKCQMFTEEPYPFAWCETHDETFPLGQVCPHYTRDMAIEKEAPGDH